MFSKSKKNSPTSSIDQMEQFYLNQFLSPSQGTSSPPKSQMRRQQNGRFSPQSPLQQGGPPGNPGIQPPMDPNMNTEPWSGNPSMNHPNGMGMQPGHPSMSFPNGMGMQPGHPSMSFPNGVSMQPGHPSMSFPTGQGMQPNHPSMGFPTGQGMQPNHPSMSFPTGQGMQPNHPSMGFPTGQGMQPNHPSMGFSTGPGMQPNHPSMSFPTGQGMQPNHPSMSFSTGQGMQPSMNFPSGSNMQSDHSSTNYPGIPNMQPNYSSVNFPSESSTQSNHPSMNYPENVNMEGYIETTTTESMSYPGETSMQPVGYSGGSVNPSYGNTSSTTQYSQPLPTKPKPYVTNHRSQSSINVDYAPSSVNYSNSLTSTPSYPNENEELTSLKEEVDNLNSSLKKIEKHLGFRRNPS